MIKSEILMVTGSSFDHHDAIEEKGHNWEARPQQAVINERVTFN